MAYVPQPTGVPDFPIEILSMIVHDVVQDGRREWERNAHSASLCACRFISRRWDAVCAPLAFRELEVVIGAPDDPDENAYDDAHWVPRDDSALPGQSENLFERNSTRSLSSFLHFLSSNPVIASYVHSLHISYTNIEYGTILLNKRGFPKFRHIHPADMNTLYGVLKALPNLKHIGLLNVCPIEEAYDAPDDAYDAADRLSVHSLSIAYSDNIVPSIIGCGYRRILGLFASVDRLTLVPKSLTPIIDERTEQRFLDGQPIAEHINEALPSVQFAVLPPSIWEDFQQGSWRSHRCHDWTRSVRSLYLMTLDEESSDASTIIRGYMPALKHFAAHFLRPVCHWKSIRALRFLGDSSMCNSLSSVTILVRFGVEQPSQLPPQEAQSWQRIVSLLLMPLMQCEPPRTLQFVEISVDVSQLLDERADEMALLHLIAAGADSLGNALSLAADAGVIRTACVRIHASGCTNIPQTAIRLAPLRQALENLLHKTVSPEVLTVVV